MELRFMIDAHENSVQSHITGHRPILWIAILSTIIVAIMIYILVIGNRITSHHTPLVDAVKEMKIEAAIGHIWLEEIISGNRNADIATVWEHLDKSAWYTRAMLEGGENSKGAFLPLRDPDFRRKIEVMQGMIKEFRVLAEERWAKVKQSDAGTARDQRFDAVFGKFLIQADDMETALQNVMDRDLHRFRVLQSLLIGLCLGVSGFIGIIFLRHERQQAHATVVLRESEERYRAIAEDTPVLICRFLPGGEITYVNNVFCAYFRKMPEELVGRNFFSLIPDANQENVLTNITTLTPESPTQSYEYTVLAPCGDTHWLRWMNRALFDDEGNIVAYQSIGEDITERKQAEDKATRFSRVLENSLNEIYIFDAETLHFVEINHGARQNLGYSIEELRNLTPLDLKPEFTTESFAELVKPLRTGEQEIVQFTTVHRRKDGSLYPVDVYLQLMTNGSPVFVAIILDITTRRLAEKALQESEDKLIEAQKIAKLGHYVLNIKTGEWTSSAGLDDIFGIDETYRKNIAGWVQIIHPDAREIMLSYLENDILKQHLRFNRQYKIIDLKTGQEKWVHGLGNLRFDDNNNPVEMFGTIQDITQRKRAELELRDSEIRSRTLLEGSPVCNKIIDLDSRLQYMSTAGIKRLKIPDIQPFYGSSYPPDFFPEATRTILTRHLEKAKTGEISSVESPALNIEGGEVWYHTTFVPARDDDGIIKYIIATSVDITERRHAEDALIAQAQTEKLLLRELDHRVRNNLASLITLIDMTANTSENINNFANSIHSRVQAMATVHTLLSRGHWQPVKLKTIIQQVVITAYKQKLKIHGPDIVIPPHKVQSLVMVLNELTTNCQKHGSFSIPDGEVHITWQLNNKSQTKYGLAIQWQETGGPPIDSPIKNSTGTRLINGIVKSELHGKIELQYPKFGAHHLLEILYDNTDKNKDILKIETPRRGVTLK